MKFLCGNCETRMECKEAKKGEKLSMWILFSCPNCKNKVYLLTNPGETQLVHSLGVSIGEERARGPLALTMTTLENHGEPIWTDEALNRLDNIPSFVRPMAKKAIEKYARKKNYPQITVQVLEEARREIGM